MSAFDAHEGFRTLNIVYIGALHPIDAKICKFVGYANRTDARVVAEALYWRRDIQHAGFTSVDAFPGDDGEILISGIQGDFTFEVVVENDLTFTCSLSKDEVALSSSSRARREIAARSLREAAALLWTSSGGLRKISSTPVRSASLGSLSENRPVWMEACL